jgi:hypothetical protein
VGVVSATRVVVTPAQHRQRHVELHAALDELFADYVRHHPAQVRFLDMPFRLLLTWAYEQTLTPTEDRQDAP